MVGVESILSARAALAEKPAAVEEALLELFAPTSGNTTVNRHSFNGNNAALWRSDAIHRAKNLAQLTISLANIAEHPSRSWLPVEVTAQARSLSRAYEELGDDGDEHENMPCATLLSEVATRLTNVFGRARQVAILVEATPLLLPRDMRRALVLMCSEMVINALKYGYPAETTGTISVVLASTPDGIELVVEDDGVGIVKNYAPGQGGGLLDQLAGVAGTVLKRTTGGSGHGFRVSAMMPVHVSQKISA